MTKIYFSHDEIQQRPNKKYPADDPFQIHYHFRPARPANLCVTLDHETGEPNISAGTLGPLTWNPYTMCLHISKNGSPHSYNNLIVGGECVVGLPGRDIVRETWFTALPLPRGISEADVAGMHLFPSKFVKVPSVQECPVNFECKVEVKTDYYTHGIVFLRVIGASIDEKVLKMNREEVVHWYPTYEVDDKANRFGGSIERLGVMGEILECPQFPLAPKAGWYQEFETWMNELNGEGLIDDPTRDAIVRLKNEFNALFPTLKDPRRAAVKDALTMACRLIVQEKWEDLKKGVRSRFGKDS